LCGRPLTFDLELKIGSKPVTPAPGNIHANFGSLCLLVFELGAGTGLRDGQTDGLPAIPVLRFIRTAAYNNMMSLLWNSVKLYVTKYSGMFQRNSKAFGMKKATAKDSDATTGITIRP